MTPERSSSEPAGQLKLHFPEPRDDQAPLITVGVYEAAWLTLKRWKHWPEGQMSLVGQPASGKTRLSDAWAELCGAATISGEALSNADIEEISGLSVSALAIDDADSIERGEALLAAINLCRQRRAPLLLTSVREPSGWKLGPGDLQSRLKAYPVLKIPPIDDDALKSRLISACKSRYMLLPEDTADYLAMRMERSYGNIQIVVEALEACAAGKALNKATARRALDSLPHVQSGSDDQN